MVETRARKYEPPATTSTSRIHTNNNTASTGSNKGKGIKRTIVEQSQPLPDGKRTKYANTTMDYSNMNTQPIDQSALSTSMQMNSAADMQTLQNSSAIDTNKHIRRVPNFLVSGGRDIDIRGMPSALEAFEASTRLGKMQAIVNGDSEISSLLEAMRVSITALHQNDGKIPPTISLLRSITDNNTSTTQGMGGDVIQEGTFFLSILSPIMGETYQLGHVQYDAALQGYNVNLAELIPRTTPTKIVWILKENTIRQDTPWAGFAVPSENRDGAVEIVDDDCHSTSDGSGLSDVEIEDGSGEYEDNHMGDDQQMHEDHLFAREKDQMRRNAMARPSQRDEARIKKTPLHGIRSAPPADTDLPWEYMANITSVELVTYFPNHVCHWTSPAAFLMEDDWTFTGATEWVNFVYRSGQDHILQNTLQCCMSRGCARFYRRPGWSRQVYLKKKSERTPEQTAKTIRHLQTQPWEPVRPVFLKPSWSLPDIGRYFETRPDTFPCEGPFTEKLKETLLGNAITPGPALNPPSLPLNWFPGQLVLPNEAQPQARMVSTHGAITSISSKTTNKGKGPAALVYHSKRKVRLANIDKTLLKNPRELIRCHHNQIADELLLWLLEKNGGGMSVNQVFGTLEQVIGELNRDVTDKSKRIKVIGRSSISKRKEAALKARAKRNGRHYDQEKADFAKLEADYRLFPQDSTTHLAPVDTDTEDSDNGNDANADLVSTQCTSLRAETQQLTSGALTDTNLTGANMGETGSRPDGYAPVANMRIGLYWHTQMENAPSTDAYTGYAPAQPATGNQESWNQNISQNNASVLYSTLTDHMSMYANPDSNCSSFSGILPAMQDPSRPATHRSSYGLDGQSDQQSSEQFTPEQDNSSVLPQSKGAQDDLEVPDFSDVLADLTVAEFDDFIHQFSIDTDMEMDIDPILE